MKSEFAEELAVQIRVLERMFDDPGLATLRRKHPEHPAVRRFDAIGTQLRHRGGLAYGEEASMMSEMAAMLFDRSTWAVERDDADYWAFIKSPSHRKRITELIKDPAQYGDLVAEVFYWGWLREEGFDADWVDEPALPDLVAARNTALEAWADVKRIRLDSRPDRVAEHIAKANRQMKAAGAQSGIVFIRVERATARAALDDRIPSDIRPHVERVERILRSQQCKSVATVVVTWDEYMAIGDVPEPTFFVFRRRSIVREHSNARAPSRIASGRLEVGRTMTVWVRWTGDPTQRPHDALRPIASAGVEVTQLFRELNEFGEGIRPGHAIEVFHDPDATFRSELGSFSVKLMARHVDLASKPFALLILAVERPNRAPEIQLGFKIYEDHAENGQRITNPRRLLDHVLTRYGLRIEVGTQSGLFIERAVIPFPGPVFKGASSEDMFASAFLYIRPNGTEAEVAWAFAIDRRRYLAAVRAKRS